MVTLASSTSFAQQRPLMLWMHGVISHSLARLTGTRKRTPMQFDTESLGLKLTNGIDNRRSPKPTHKHAPSECWPPLLPNLWNTSVRTVPLGPSEAQKCRGCRSSFIDTLGQKRLHEALGTPTKVYSVPCPLQVARGSCKRALYPPRGGGCNLHRVRKDEEDEPTAWRRAMFH